MSIELFGLKNIPIIDGDSDISLIIREAIEKQGCGLKHGDIVLIAETLISKSEENFIKLDEINPSHEAIELAQQTGKDPKLVEAILNESNEVIKVGPNFIITETKHGFVCANAGIDESNVGEGLATPMPNDADSSAISEGVNSMNTPGTGATMNLPSFMLPCRCPLAFKRRPAVYSMLISIY